MKSAVFLLVLLTTLAIAVPTGTIVPRQTDVDDLDTAASDLDTCETDALEALCTLGTPLCCRTDTEGLTTMDCLPPTSNLTNVPSTSSLTSIQTACLINGSRKPRCCTVNAAGQALFCNDLTTPA